MSEEVAVKQHKYMTLLIILYFIIFALIVLHDPDKAEDAAYLNNRIAQVQYNLSHGFDITFYFDDFVHTGYGTSFYYGGLTLIPFALLPIEAGFNLYILVSRFLVLFGLYKLVKTFIKDNSKAQFCTFVIATSEYFIFSMTLISLFPNYMGLGLSYFCLAYAIEFFRDKKQSSGYIMCLFYFLTMNTHSISAFLTAIGLIIICLWYFDKKQIKKYALMLLLALSMIAYNVANILYHSDTFTAETRHDINVRLIQDSDGLTFGNVFFGRLLGLFGLGDFNTYPPFDLILLTFTIIIIIKKRKELKEKLTKKHIVLFSVIFVSLIIGEHHIWSALLQKIDIFFQFPTRYGNYILPLIIIFVFREADIKIEKIYKIIVLIVMCTFYLYSLFAIKHEDYFGMYKQYIVNGEYLVDFDWNYEKFEKNRQRVLSLADDKEIPYEYYKDGVLVEYQGDKTTLQIPKLYYRGYIAEDLDNNNERFEVKMGYSQWINIDINDNNHHKLFIHYKHPLFLTILRYLAFVSVLSTIFLLVRTKVHRKT